MSLARRCSQRTFCAPPVQGKYERLRFARPTMRSCDRSPSATASKSWSTTVRGHVGCRLAETTVACRAMGDSRSSVAAPWSRLTADAQLLRQDGEGGGALLGRLACGGQLRVECVAPVLVEIERYVVARDQLLF